MARAKSNGDGRLDETIRSLNQSMANLNQSTASLNQAMAVFLAQCAETNARLNKLEAETSERFARVEAILMKHSRILRALPEAIREKIGFKPREPRPAG